MDGNCWLKMVDGTNASFDDTDILSYEDAAKFINDNLDKFICGNYISISFEQILNVLHIEKFTPELMKELNEEFNCVDCASNLNLLSPDDFNTITHESLRNYHINEYKKFIICVLFDGFYDEDTNSTISLVRAVDYHYTYMDSFFHKEGKLNGIDTIIFGHE